MKRYNKLSVPIELTAADTGAVHWASRVSPLAGPAAVLFVHSVEVPGIPEAAKKKYPWPLEPHGRTPQD